MHRTKLVPHAAFGILVSSLLLGSVITCAWAQEAAPPPPPPLSSRVEVVAPGGEVRVPIGATKVVRMRSNINIQTAENPRPDIAVVQGNQADPASVTITGRQSGTTRITLTDENGNSESYGILVELDVEYLKTILKRAAPTANIDLIPTPGPANAPGAIIISGTVTHIEDINLLVRVGETMVGVGRAINNLRLAGVMQVQLDVVIASVSRTELRRMNFDFVNNGGSHWLNQSLGGAITTSSFEQPVGQPLLFENTFGNPNGQASNYFLGLFNNNQQFFGFLQVLRSEQIAKLLAEPRLVVMSGKQATFLVGGEQAVPSPGGLGAVSVQFVPFGTQVSFLPVVLGNGKIYLEVEPTVSALSAAAGVTIAGFTVAGRDEARIHTQVEMEEGQTFVLGGLIQHTVNGTTRKTPLLGDLPFIGTMFSSKLFEEEERELVIMVTPHLVDQLDCGQASKVVVPGQETRSPDDFELYLEGILEAPRGPREVCKDRHYVPAYKNSPSASAMPCATQKVPRLIPDRAGIRGGCNGQGCGTSGLAEGSTIGYPGILSLEETGSATSTGPANKAELLAPVEMNSEPASGGTSAAPTTGENKTPTLFDPTVSSRAR